MENKEDIIRKYIKGIVSIEIQGKVIYVSTKNCFARTSILEFLKNRLGCKEILVEIKQKDGLLMYVIE